MSGGFGSVRFAIAVLVPNIVLAVSAFAQSDIPRSSILWTTDVVRVYAPVESRPAGVTPPPNLRIPPAYQPYVESMVRWSPTFRRQCLRLANAPWLTIVLRSLPTRPSALVRARTQFSTDGRRHVTATMTIGAADDQVELIAHEIEHVIEQLDGVDLRARASLPATGVTSWDHDMEFETIRAIRAGRAVAEEVRRRPG
jgi:hypothetical protein